MIGVLTFPEYQTIIKFLEIHEWTNAEIFMHTGIINAVAKTFANQQTFSMVLPSQCGLLMSELNVSLGFHETLVRRIVDLISTVLLDCAIEQEILVEYTF